jgi:hypothetical protein
MAGTLGQDICKIPLGTLFRIHSPEAVLYVPLGHKDLGIILSFRKSMDDACKGMTKLVDSTLWSGFDSCCIDQR